MKEINETADFDRNAYLEAMGINQWEPRLNSASAIVESTVSASVELENTTTKLVKGLSWLNHGSKNGLLVVLPVDRSHLSKDQRSLMSKMLNSIGFLPSDTGFATVTSSNLDVEQSYVSSIVAILALGDEAGANLVRFSGARNVPGTDQFLLEGIDIISTLHPEDLLIQPSLKNQAWKDLQLLASLIKNK